MSHAGKLVLFDFDHTIANAWNVFNPFVATWRPLPSARTFLRYHRETPERTFILTARYARFEGRALLQRFLRRLGVEDFADDHILCAGFLRNRHRAKARIVRALIETYHPVKVLLFDDEKRNRDVVEPVEDAFPQVNIVVVDPRTARSVGRVTPDVDD